MPWFRVDDQFGMHPKVLAAGNAAAGLWLRCAAYAASQLTDGHVPLEVARLYGKPVQAIALVTAGLWHATGHDCRRCPQPANGYQMHDYEEWNPTRAKVVAAREKKKEAGRKGGEASGASRRGEADAEALASPSASEAVQPEPDHSGSASPNTHPIPSHPTQGSSKTSNPPPSSVPRGKSGGGGGNPDEDDPVLAAFVDEVLVVRPEWSRRSVLRALTDEDVAQRPWHVIKHAMLAVARDTTSQQPGRLVHDGPWWRLPAQPRTAPAPPAVDLLAGGDHRPETRERGLAAARAELAARIGSDP
jgi:general stress protein YciG